jgi:hypothetical protein
MLNLRPPPNRLLLSAEGVGKLSRLRARFMSVEPRIGEFDGRRVRRTRRRTVRRPAAHRRFLVQLIFSMSGNFQVFVNNACLGP